MAKRNTVKTSRKVIEPIFHIQTKGENDCQLSKGLIKTTRQTGKLNLSGRSLNMVPERLWTLYDLDKEEMSLDYRLNNSTEDQPWWNFTPLQYLDLSSNCLNDIPSKIKMFQDLLVLNLHDNLLTDLPKELEELEKLIKLNISHNKLQIIPNCVYKLTELTSLLISYNNVEQVSKDIGDLIMLQELDLSHNKIEELPPGLGYMVRLTQANFSYNKLIELPPDIVNMRVLQKLDVTHNELKSLPPMGELRKLQFLYATHNDILKMPDCEGCENLQELYLGNNFIEEITPEFCESMSHLKVLDLKDNKIKEIPTEIAKLEQLIRFDITNNELTNLPNCLGFMKRLQNLHVEGNKIRLIRRDILQCGTVRILKFLRGRNQAEVEKCESNSDTSNTSTPRSLEAPIEMFPDKWAMKNGRNLNLTMKQISTVPDEVFRNAVDANVNNVDLSRNKFTEVPSNLEILAENVQELSLNVNALTSVPDFLSKFERLQYLNLSSNVLNTLPESLGNCAHLRELIISNNKFVEIPSCIYEMVGLEILLASDNRITSIDAEGFLKLKRLATLDLSNNNIESVPPELGKMTQIRSLLITGNSFRAPRYAILVKGTDAILSYLRDRIPNNS